MLELSVIVIMEKTIKKCLSNSVNKAKFKFERGRERENLFRFISILLTANFFHNVGQIFEEKRNVENRKVTRRQ